MNTITVSKTFKVTIKGQEFELTADEAKALHVALDAALDKPTVVVSPKRNAPLDDEPPFDPRPWRQPFPHPPVDSFPREPRRPRPGEMWALQEQVRRFEARRQSALLLESPFFS